MKKFIKYWYFGLIVVIYYLFINFMFNGQNVIFPIFMITSFVFASFLNKKQAIHSFSILTLIWFVHFFRESAIKSNIIIYFIFTPLTFYLGHLLGKKRYFIKFFYTVLLLFIGLYGIKNFTALYYNIESRNIVKIKNYNFSDNNNELVMLNDLKDKIIVLDLWTTNCGVCFKKFPKFDDLYKKYKTNNDIVLYTLNIPIKNDSVGKAHKMIDKYDYSFPKLYAKNDDITKDLKIDKYPHLLIIKNGNIRYSGNYIIDNEIVFYNTENEIYRILNEELKN